MKNTFYTLIILLSFILLAGCTATDPKNEMSDIPVFDVAMQAVNPAWFQRAMEGVDYGIHREERYGVMAGDTTELFENTFAEMEKNNVQMGLLSHGVYKERLLEKLPDKFLLSFEPDLSLEDHTEAAKQFEEEVINGKYAALGELGLIYEGIPINTPDLYPYYEVAEKHGIPVFIHTGFSGPNPQKVLSPAFRIDTADPLLLEKVITDFPNLKIVMMHFGWPFFDEALYILGTYPNVYMDTSVAIWLLGDELFNRMLKEAVATAGSKKILFGTLQMAWPEVLTRSVNTIKEADFLIREEKENILWNNAVMLFGVEGIKEK